MTLTAPADARTAAPTGTRPGARTGSPSPERRLVEAALRCIARWGLTKTTLDDISREARCSRATVYRLFPGGKETLVEAIVADELLRFFAGLDGELRAAADLEDLLVAGITYTTRTLQGHEALQFLLAHEPGRILPEVAFARFDGVLDLASGAVAPHLAPWVGAEGARRAGEWVTRLVLSYSMAPSASFDLADADDARRFVTTFLLPGLVVREPDHH